MHCFCYFIFTFRYPQISKAVQKKYMSSEAFSRKIHNLVAVGKWSGIVRKPNKLVNDKWVNLCH